MTYRSIESHNNDPADPFYCKQAAHAPHLICMSIDFHVYIFSFSFSGESHNVSMSGSRFVSVFTVKT